MTSTQTTVTSHPYIIISLLITIALAFVAIVYTNWRAVFHEPKKNISVIFIVLIALASPTLSIIKNLSKPWGLTETELNGISLNFLTLIMGSVIVVVLRVLWILDDNKKHEEVKSHWSSDGVMNTIGSAKKKIILLQTWFPDAARIADVIITHCDNQKNTLHITIYLFSPDSEAGINRFLQINSENVKDKSPEVAKAGFICQSISSLDNFIQRFEKTETLSIEINTYTKMPHEKVYIIDDDILCASFPALRGSTSSNPTLIKKSDQTKPEKKAAAQSSLDQIKVVKADSTLYYQKKPGGPGEIFGRYYFENIDLRKLTSLSAET